MSVSISAALLPPSGALAAGIARLHYVHHSVGIWTQASAYRSGRSLGHPAEVATAGLSKSLGSLAHSSVPNIVVSSVALHCLGTMGGPPSLGPKATLAGLQCLSLARPPIVPIKPAKNGKRSHRPSVSPQLLAKLAVDRAIALAGKPGLQLAPARVGLTGLDTFFWVAPRPRPVVAQAAVPGLRVTARAHPVQYIWHFGDGGEAVTVGPGRPWTRTHPGSIAHDYQTRARYAVSVQIIWKANWRIGAGRWRSLGTFVTSSARSFPVRQAVAVLVKS